MATPTVNDLDGLLASLNQLKPPGASKTKIASITTLCVNNIQAESSIVQSFYRALKKAPATHKLGALYVIDSVVRQWIEKAKASGQELARSGRGEPGTYSAAVKRVTELMPALFDDIIKGIPAEQKPKLENMITIWERGSTFPAPMLSEFKSKASGAPSSNAVAAPTNGVHAQVDRHPVRGQKFVAPVPTRPLQTPVGYPPRQLYDQGFLPGRSAPSRTDHSTPQQQPPVQTFQQPIQSQPPTQTAPATDVNSILAALSKAAAMAPAPVIPTAAQPAAQNPPMPAGLPPQFAALFGQQAALPPAPYAYSTPSAPPMPQAYQPPPQFLGYPPQPPPSIPQTYAVAPPPPPQQQQLPPQPDLLAPLRGFLPENILNDKQKLVPALQLLQDLQKDGIPPEKWGPVLQAFEEQYKPQAPSYGGQVEQGRGRGRSRSPEREGRGGRGSPVYGSYDANARNQHDDNRDPRGGNQRGRYRQRSPLPPSHDSTAMNGKPMQPKYIAFDQALPPDNIKVLSRTLFVGGANGSQQEIQRVFERFGRVQTCIANRDKRHAFVKMATREHALAAKTGMEDLQSRNDREVMAVARQTKWGVGFGPRECCDYQRGESIIPIHKLTEADMKWLLTAEYGGTGGQPVEGGMVLEEPDIEIGAGVSSKAMSKRVGPDNAPSNKRRGDDRGGRHAKHHKGPDHAFGAGGYSGVAAGIEPFAYPRPEPVAVATPPAVPGFGFNLGLPTAGQNTYR